MTAKPAKRSRWRTVLHWLEGIVGAALALILFSIAAGAIFEWVSAQGDAQRMPPPGRLVDIGGGMRLHLRCTGSGTPAVIFDSGLGGTMLDWDLVQPAVAKTTRACSYDRAGMGWSDPAQGHRSPQRIAEELHALLIAAHIGGPYVLVAHSLGGKNIRMFARDYPDDVAGMVLVDARSEYMDFHASAADKQSLKDQLSNGALTSHIGRTLGIVRLFGANLFDGPLPDATRQQAALLDTAQKSIDAVAGEGTALTGSDIELRDAPPLGNRPLIVIASGENMDANKDWRASQLLQAKFSRDGRLIVAKGSGHYVQWERPGLVISAVDEVVQKVRRATATPASP
ncbi:MAG TPA: alpha/beta hydrolase [Rhizomicrobium sp.]|jgi:pimeloyl-ACP methyl ester carboxylesterase|nr:alpha/beta hydrolase [Rhizomicrobium sp.]